MTDRFLFSVLSTMGIISGATTLSFGGSYIAGKYVPRPKPVKYITKKIAKIDSIEDIQEYEDIQGCTFLFRRKREATQASAPQTSSPDYTSLESFRGKKDDPKIDDRMIVTATEAKRSQCSLGAAVYVEI
ncbi:hypothetical protein MHF_0674 [Mycoplasma haemofelis Ohio2]|uniref:Uncharacterized protein n=1 Tax=Mycoplasma haemofelis (strain Ohio2) TaxID=859194 RepID=F6FI96_MYCHI|nr:hypothetical protein MHF_0674 [Mycoplasma haemofelis Ohio2]